MNLKNIILAEIAVAALALLIIRPMIFGSMKRVMIERKAAVEEIRRKLGDQSAALTPEEQDNQQKALKTNMEIQNRILASLEEIKEKLGSTIIKDTDVPVVVEKITKLTQGMAGVELVAIKPDIAPAGEGVGFQQDFGAPDAMGGMNGQNLKPEARTEELNINIEVKSKYKDLIDYFEKLSALPIAFYVKSLEITHALDEFASEEDLPPMQAMPGGFDWPPEGGSSVVKRPAGQKKAESKALSSKIVITTVLTK